MSATFNILHVSDMHLSGKVEAHLNPIPELSGIERAKYVLSQAFRGENPFYPSTYDRYAALALARFIARTVDSIDLLLITGDLATTGFDNDLLFANDFLHGKYPSHWYGGLPGIKLPNIIEQNIPIATLPGNHDRYRDVSFSPNSQSYEDIFGENWDIGTDKCQSIADSPFVKRIILQKNNERLTVYCIDFSLRARGDGEGTFGYIGQGRVYQDVIEALEKDMSEVSKSIDSAYLWALHFSPRHPEENDTLKLINQDDFIVAAERNSIPLLLSGHVHVQGRYAVGSNVEVVSAGTACSVDKNERQDNNITNTRISVNNSSIINIIDDVVHYDGMAFK